MDNNESDFENKIINLFQKFRENPKYILEQKKYIKNKKKRKEFEDYINSLEKIPELIFDKNLCKIAEEELANLENYEYNYLQIGEEFQAYLGEEYIPKEGALIVLEDLYDIDELFLKIIINSSDKDKKGRAIITNKSYTHFGFSKYYKGDEVIIFVFAKKRKIYCISNKPEENQIKLSKDEKNLLNQIKIFRKNPKSLLDEKYRIKNKKKRIDYETFLNLLEKMPELKLDKNLIDIAKEEMKIIIGDIDNYEKFQIGESVKAQIREKLPDKDIALLVIGDIDENENLIFKIIINELDMQKKGRNIISDKTYTYIGLSQYSPPENDDEKPVVIIFAKDKKMVDIRRVNFDILNQKINDLNRKLERYPCILNENEYLLSVVFSTLNEKILFSMICKNSDKIKNLEKKIYEKYPEISYNKNYFSFRGKIIDKNESLENNNIKDGDIVIIN